MTAVFALPLVVVLLIHVAEHLLLPLAIGGAGKVLQLGSCPRGHHSAYVSFMSDSTRGRAKTAVIIIKVQIIKSSLKFLCKLSIQPGGLLPLLLLLLPLLLFDVVQLQPHPTTEQ